MGKEERTERRAERQSTKKTLTDEGYVAPAEPSGLKYEDIMKELSTRHQATQEIVKKAQAMQQKSGSAAKALRLKRAQREGLTAMESGAGPDPIEAPLVRGAVKPVDVPPAVHGDMPPLRDPDPALVDALKRMMAQQYGWRGGPVPQPKRILTEEEIEAEPEVTGEELEALMGGG